MRMFIGSGRLWDEVFGEGNFLSLVTFTKTGGQTDNQLASVSDYILWYSRNADAVKFRQLYKKKIIGGDGGGKYTDLELPDGSRVPLNTFVGEDGSLPPGSRVFRKDTITSQSPGTRYDVVCEGRVCRPEPGYWKTDEPRMSKLLYARRVVPSATKLAYVRYFDDFPAFAINNVWTDLGGVQSRADPKIYVVQTGSSVVERCVLMTTDPGDLVLDPACGSGTTAYVAEQWGRRWITMDTSRVALALARSRIMGARYPYYTLTDSPEGQREEARLATIEAKSGPTYGDIRQGFVCRRVPHITLKAIANNTEIDTIWDQRQPAVEAALAGLNEALQGHPTPFPVTHGARKRQTVDFTAPAEITEFPTGDPAPVNGLLVWEIPREPPEDWPAAACSAVAAFWEARIIRQQEIDASIARKADFEFLYDKPIEDKAKVRVAGPFTVESLAPHRALAVDERDELIPRAAEPRAPYGSDQFGDFTTMILENLRTAGVQQAHKTDRIEFSSLTPWEGQFIAAEGWYAEGKRERRAGILIGPEFGTVARSNLVDAAREAADAGFDVVVSCAFAYDAQATDLQRLGKVPILKARMNADLHMGEDLKNTGKGNLFVIFGEPDIEIEPAGDSRIQVRLRGVDVFHPQTGEVRSDSADGIACWMLDTEYDGESFFVRHAYFPGAASDPYKALKTTLKAEIDQEAWESLRRDVSRPFPKPASGRIAVKVINHLGDEVMKIFRV